MLLCDSGQLFSHGAVTGFLNLRFIVTARRYASAVYAVVMYPSDRLSVRLLHAGIVPNRLNLISRKLR